MLLWRNYIETHCMRGMNQMVANCFHGRKRIEITFDQIALNGLIVNPMNCSKLVEIVIWRNGKMVTL